MKKLKKYKKLIINPMEILRKIRRTWSRNPVTQIIPRRKVYKRQEEKKVKDKDYE